MDSPSRAKTREIGKNYKIINTLICVLKFQPWLKEAKTKTDIEESFS